MIISLGRNYIFVHVPKTGGTSLALALEGRAKKDDILIGDTPKAWLRRKRLKAMESAGRLWKHSTLADIDGLVTRAQIADAFTFTLVRNPWDRAVSYYHWLRQQEFHHPAVKLARQLEFGDFIADQSTSDTFRAWPYARYMTAADGAERARAYIRLEEFERDAEPLWDHLGFRLALPHENRSERAADYRGYYNADTAECLARACAVDIARFGYSF